MPWCYGEAYGVNGSPKMFDASVCFWSSKCFNLSSMRPRGFIKIFKSWLFNYEVYHCSWKVTIPKGNCLILVKVIFEVGVSTIIGGAPEAIITQYLLDVEPKIGGKNPKWMVKIMENPVNKWMVWGENPIFLETPNYTWNLFVLYFGGWKKPPKQGLFQSKQVNSSTKPPFGVTNRRDRSLYFATIVPVSLKTENESLKKKHHPFRD